MATFNKEIKSNRLLQGTRYTIAQFDGQEAFTSVLDINASEIYTQEAALPTSSLPYSGSTQDGLFIQSASADIARYYYRLKMSPGNVVESSKYQTWFAISGSDGNSVDPQLVQDDQLTQWISNKYLAAEDAAKQAEAAEGQAGYKVVVSINSTDNASTAEPTSQNNYQFDYKTGVVQFTSTGVAPNVTGSVYITGYVYMGQTLNEFISSGGSGGGGTPGGATTQVQFNDGGAFAGSERLTFNKTTGLTQLSGSFEITGSVDNIFLIKSGSIDLLRMSSSGALVFGDLNHVPSPVAGGMYYSSGEFYVGTE
jgi:hypothetical protein